MVIIMDYNCVGKFEPDFLRKLNPNVSNYMLIGFLKRIYYRILNWKKSMSFTILDFEGELVKRALIEHRRLKRLFRQTSDLEKFLGHIEEELAAHIRFEERILFAEVQKRASAAQLAKINEIHSVEAFVEKEDDVFWK
ncbi:MAG TPA: hypothetical protein VF842_07585 [Flavobacterium sp.]